MEFKRKLVNSRIAIHCDTFEKAEQLFKILESWGVVWGGNKPLNHYKDLGWNHHKDQTCYSLNGYRCKNVGDLMCSNIVYNQKNGYEIWTFEQFIEEYERTEGLTLLEIFKKYNMFTRNWTATWLSSDKNMEEKIMKTNIKTENNKTILTFLTDGLTKKDLKISYFKKYEDEYKVDLKVEVIKGNQFVKEGFEQIITIDRIKITKKLNAKYNDGMVTIEFNNIDENIDVEFED